MSRIRRALEVWRGEGLRSLAARVRRRLHGWRPASDLLWGLDAALPPQLAVGQGSLLFLSGWCFHPSAHLRRLEIVVNGVGQPVTATGLARPDACALHFPERDPRGHSYGSGFATLVALAARDAGLRVDVHLRAALRDGTTASALLGSIQLEPAGERPGRPAEAGPAPRIAICMTTYNPPMDLFRRQVESIRDQTVRDWICLVSDDGSLPDHLAKIVRITAGDARFRVFPGGARAGFYRNFERALSLVPEGTAFVALSDHDDRWHPEKLETLLAAFDERTTLAYSDMNIIDTQGRLLSNTYWTTRPNNHEDLASLLIANTITGAASLFRGALLARALPFPQEIARPFHDQWIAALALATGSVAYVDRPLYDYVQHTDNVLGHYAPARVSLWTNVRTALRLLLGRERRRLDTVVSSWRSVYFGELQRVKLAARTLELRCAGAIAAEKAAPLRRLARLDESWGTTLWLALRDAKSAGRVSATLRGESTLLRGLLWRIGSKARARFGPRGATAGRAQQERPPSRPAAAVLEGVALIEQKIAPLRLRLAHDAPRRVNLLVPTIDFTYFFGGYIAKFNLARRLAGQGERVRIVTVDHTPERRAEWMRRVRAYQGLEGVFDEVEVALAADRELPLEVNPADRFVATTWWTAHVAQRAVEALGGGRFLYLIQEYEPYTFPRGSLSALANQSYDFPHLALFSTELLRDSFRQGRIGVFAAGPEAGERESIAFDNAITPVAPVTVAEIAGRQPRRLLFYARPEPHAARNMFELALLGLSKAIADGGFGGGWEFHGLGTVGGASTLPLGSGRWLRIHPRHSQDEYQQVLRAHDVGLSLMDTPHPSLVPIEMASAGMLVVTNTCANKTAERLAAISPNLLAVEPTIEGVARGLREAAAGTADYERRVAGSHLAWSTSWDESFNPEVMKRIREFLAACGSPGGKP